MIIKDISIINIVTRYEELINDAYNPDIMFASFNKALKADPKDGTLTFKEFVFLSEYFSKKSRDIKVPKPRLILGTTNKNFIEAFVATYLQVDNVDSYYLSLPKTYQKFIYYLFHSQLPAVLRNRLMDIDDTKAEMLIHTKIVGAKDMQKISQQIDEYYYETCPLCGKRSIGNSLCDSCKDKLDGLTEFRNTDSVVISTVPITQDFHYKNSYFTFSADKDSNQIFAKYSPDTNTQLILSIQEFQKSIDTFGDRLAKIQDLAERLQKLV